MSITPIMQRTNRFTKHPGLTNHKIFIKQAVVHMRTLNRELSRPANEIECSKDTMVSLKQNYSLVLQEFLKKYKAKVIEIKLSK